MWPAIVVAPIKVYFDASQLLRCGDVELNPGPILRGLQWNVQGLTPSKYMALSKMLEDELIVWCVLFETHFTPYECSNFKVAGFEHVGHARDKRDKNVGGGVSILVRTNCSVQVADRFMVELPGLELVVLTLALTDDKKMKLAAVYFIESQYVTSEAFSKITSEIPTYRSAVVAVGCSCQGAPRDSMKAPDYNGSPFASWCEGLGLTRANTGEATWRRSATELPTTRPDETLSRNCVVEDWTPIFTPDSDHAQITMDVLVGTTPERPTTFKQSTRLYSWNWASWLLFRRYTRTQFGALKQEYEERRTENKKSKIQRLAWRKHQLLPQREKKAPEDPAMAPACESKPRLQRRVSVNELAMQIARIIRKGVARSVPCMVAKRAPIWTPELTQLEKDIKECRDPQCIDQLIERRGIRLRELTTSRWCMDFSHIDPSVRASRDLLNRVFTPRVLEFPAMVVCDAPLTARQQATQLITLYTKKFPRHVKAQPVVWPRAPEKQFLLFTIGELEQAICEMPLGSAPGEDGVCVEALQKLPRAAKRQLLRLYNLSCMRCQVPSAWRTTLVIPIPKQGRSLEDPFCLRPVALTSHLCKVMELMVARRIRSTAELRMCPQHFAYFSKGSSADAFVSLLSRKETRGERERVGAVFIQYDRALETVNHSCVIDALVLHKVDPWLIRWIAAFLQDRIAMVKIHDSLSRKGNIPSGIPQGTVLGPLLSMITMDSLSERLTAISGVTHALFTNHIAIVVKGDDTEEIEGTLQTALDCVASWMYSRHMELDVSQSRYTFDDGDNHGELTLMMGRTLLRKKERLNDLKRELGMTE